MSSTLIFRGRKLIAKRLVSSSNYRHRTLSRYWPKNTLAKIVSDTIDKLKKRRNIGALRLQLPDPFRASSISLEGNRAVERVGALREPSVLLPPPPSRREIDRSLPAANSRSSDGTRGGIRGGEENNMSRTFRRWLVHRARDAWFSERSQDDGPLSVRWSHHVSTLG